MHISWVIEALSSTPKKLLSRVSSHFFSYVVNYLSKLCVSGAKITVLRRKVTVMEAEIVDRKLVHYLESNIDFLLSSCLRSSLAPSLVSSAAAEHISAVATHCVPP